MTDFTAIAAMHKAMLFSYLVSTVVVVVFGPSSWPTHYAYHGWNLFTGTAALPLIVQAIIYAQLACGLYLVFDEKIRYYLTLLTYSEEAAAEIAALQKQKQQQLVRSAELSRSRLPSGSTPASA